MRPRGGECGCGLRGGVVRRYGRGPQVGKKNPCWRDYALVFVVVVDLDRANCAKKTGWTMGYVVAMWIWARTRWGL